jgi:hypothetical protein
MAPLYDETYLSNLALSHVGSPPIPSWDGNSVEAIQAEQIFPIARDMTLSMHDWGFASRDDTLTAAVETYTGWDYTYVYPADCLAFREIINPAKTNATYVRTGIRQYDHLIPIKWDVKLNADDVKKRIVTNEAEAEGRYTTRVENLTLWTIPALEALACVLGGRLAVILKGDLQRKKDLMKEALQYTGFAEGHDAGEQEDQADDSSSLSKSRN